MPIRARTKLEINEFGRSRVYVKSLATVTVAPVNFFFASLFLVKLLVIDLSSYLIMLSKKLLVLFRITFHLIITISNRIKNEDDAVIWINLIMN